MANMSGEIFDPFRDLEDIEVPTLPSQYRINCVQYMSEFEKRHWTYRCEVRSDDKFMHLAQFARHRETDYKINYTFFTIHAEASGESTYSYNLQTFFNASDPSTIEIPSANLVASVQAMLRDIHTYITKMLQGSETFKTISENITGVHLFDQVITDDYNLITNVTFPIVPGYVWVMRIPGSRRFKVGLIHSSATLYGPIQIPILTITSGGVPRIETVETPDGKSQEADANNSIISICQAVVDLYTERAVNAMKAGNPLIQTFNSNFPDQQVLSALSKLTNIVDQLVSRQYSPNRL